MKKMLQKIGNALGYIWNVLGFVLFFAVILAALSLFGKVAQILSPVIILGFFAIGTLFACTNSRPNKILCLSGLAIYIASFAVAGHLGTMAAMVLCLGGLLMWFQSAISAFCHRVGVRSVR